MQPDNPIVGGITLRIPAIRSPNYVAGSAGWTINIDGSAEFANATVRGQLTEGNAPSGAGLIITSAGVITVYDSAGHVVGNWDPSTSIFRVQDAAGDKIILDPKNVNGPTLQFQDSTGLNTTSIHADYSAAPVIKLIIDAATIVDAGTADIRTGTMHANVSGSVETWHTPTLLNNFTQATPTLQYRMLASPPNTVQLYGWITSGATVASGTAICQLPAAYRPGANTLPHEANNAGPGTTLWLGLQADGNVALHGSWTNGAAIQIDAFFPIDK